MIIRLNVIYKMVRPIMLKIKKLYHIQLWDNSDWDQEAMLVLHKLITEHPEIVGTDLLYTYFKTKFSNYIKDELRKQEAIKRQFNKMPYDEISEVGHMVPSQEMEVADKIVYLDMLSYIKGQLKPDELETLERVMTGEKFKGRRAFIRKLQELTTDWR